jgi:hypothetical protein
VTASPVADEQRLNVLPRYFGAKLTYAELLVYQWMGQLCEGYGGGYWNFRLLSNGGFYMAPQRDEPMQIRVETNGYEGAMSADAAGVTACLFAFCDMANRTGSEQERFIDLYYHLREYAACHAECAEILRAID